MWSISYHTHKEGAAFVNIYKGGAASGPLFVGMVRNAAHNALHAADHGAGHAPGHAAGHAPGHAVQNHVLKIMYPDFGMPKPCI